MKRDKDIIDSILLINWYLVKCKIEDSKYVDLTRKYLTFKIDKALKNEFNYSQFKAKSILGILF